MAENRYLFDRAVNYQAPTYNAVEDRPPLFATRTHARLSRSKPFAGDLLSGMPPSSKRWRALLVRPFPFVSRPRGAACTRETRDARRKSRRLRTTCLGNYTEKTCFTSPKSAKANSRGIRAFRVVLARLDPDDAAPLRTTNPIIYYSQLYYFLYFIFFLLL